jgi:ferredoxin
VVLLSAEVDVQDADAVHSAVAHCPSGALRITED